MSQWQLGSKPDSPPLLFHVRSEWTAVDPADPGAGVGSTRRVLLRVGEPQFNHDGGAVNFDSAGNLYISLGDGGSANDDVFAVEPDGHTDIIGNGQDISNVLGSILRIDPLGTNAANGQYGIPADNPFVATAGAAPEIYAYGFRNPFRFSIDTDDSRYVGDVGQNDIEEVDHVTAPGQNFGWNAKEGTFCFNINPEDGDGFAVDPEGALCPREDSSMVDPIAEYDNHIEGHSVIGGFVCRGCGIDAIEGRYVFGDFAKVFVFTRNSADPETAAFDGLVKLSVAPGRLFYLDVSNNIAEFRGGSPTGVLLGMGQDATGALYVLGNATGLPTVGDTTGTVHRLVPGGGRGRP